MTLLHEDARELAVRSGPTDTQTDRSAAPLTLLPHSLPEFGEGGSLTAEVEAAVPPPHASLVVSSLGSCCSDLYTRSIICFNSLSPCF